MTKTLYASEGKPIASDANLPASFLVRCTLLAFAAHVVGCCAETVVCAGCCAAGQAYVAEQTESCASFRTESCLRLRDQVARLQSLLSDAPSVGIADATVRAIRSAGEQSTSVLSDYSREARCVCCVTVGLSCCMFDCLFFVFL